MKNQLPDPRLTQVYRLEATLGQPYGRRAHGRHRLPAEDEFDRVIAVDLGGTLLGMKHQIGQVLAQVGDRPPLEFPGYWLYAGVTPWLHIAERDSLLGTRRRSRANRRRLTGPPRAG